jgi:hypothetical protein
VRPLVPTLLVLPREVRRASDEQQARASAKRKPQNSVSGEASRFTCPSMRRRDQGPIALQPAKSSVTPPDQSRSFAGRRHQGPVRDPVASRHADRPARHLQPPAKDLPEPRPATAPNLTNPALPEPSEAAHVAV